jgi:uncharacterized protein YjbJ (UPF0337 family)
MDRSVRLCWAPPSLGHVCRSNKPATPAETLANPWLFHPHTGITTYMGILDKFKNKGEAAKGDAKQKVGEALGNEQMQAEGKVGSAKGNLKQAGEKVKDAI